MRPKLFPGKFQIVIKNMTVIQGLRGNSSEFGSSAGPIADKDECQLNGYALSLCFFSQLRGAAKNLYIAGRQAKPI